MQYSGKVQEIKRNQHQENAVEYFNIKGKKKMMYEAHVW